MSAPRSIGLADGRTWLRVAHAGETGATEPGDATSRWTSAGDGPALLLAGDVETARAQLAAALAGSSIDISDLRDDAPYVLHSVTLPAKQRVADGLSEEGLKSLGLPVTYPRKPRGGAVGDGDRRKATKAARAGGLRGVVVRAEGSDGAGEELVWFPARGASASTTGRAKAFSKWAR